MKQNLLNLIYFAFFALLLYNCSKEDTINYDTKKQSLFTLKTISKKDLMSNKKVVKQLNKLRNSDFISSNRNDYDETYDFFIETDSVKVVESTDGNYNSYTFAISNEEDNKDYNLVFSLNDNQEYESKIVEYDFSNENSYTVSYADIDLDNSDYLTTRQPGSFVYECVMTMSLECTVYTEVNGITSCIEAVSTLINTNCSYTYFANAPSNTTSNIYNYIWIGGGGGGGSSGNPPNNPNIGSSFNPPSYSLQFSTFFNSLTDDQQSFVDDRLGLKLKLFNIFYDLNSNSNSVITEIINIMMSNPLLTLDSAIDLLITTDQDIEDYFASQIIISPDDPIDNIAQYLECFDSTQPAQITIHADQPTANDDEAWSISGGVGHSFITINQGNTTRSFGLYPEGNASPFYPEDPHVFGNNQNTEFDVSVSIEVSAFQLSAIIFESTDYETNYHLSTNNCTTFALEISQLTDLEIPSTIGNWPGGNGNNPGALGEDLRNLELSSGATRDDDGGDSPQNSALCN